MTDKQKQILAVLSRDGVTTTPTKIGEACGKHYDVASSWACAGLKGLVKAGLVEKSGSWFSYDSVRIGQGRENAKQFLKENTEMCDRLEAAIRSRTDEVAEEMMTGPDAED